MNHECKSRNTLIEKRVVSKKKKNFIKSITIFNFKKIQFKKLEPSQVHERKMNKYDESWVTKLNLLKKMKSTI